MQPIIVTSMVHSTTRLFVKTKPFIDLKTIDHQSKDLLNALQNNNFIEQRSISIRSV